MKPFAKAGFTLIEALISLTVIAFCLLLLSWLPSQRITQQIESRLFFDQLTSELNLAQEISLIQQETVLVRFSVQAPEIIFYLTGTASPYALLEVPNHWQVRTNFLLTYLPNGRIAQFTTVYFSHEDGRSVGLAFQLGSGRFEIQF